MEIHLDKMYQMHGKNIHITTIWEGILSNNENFTSNINITVDRIDTEKYLVQGEMEVTLDCKCSKCLQPVAIKLIIPLHITFVHKMESTGKEIFVNNDYSDVLKEQEIEIFSESKLYLAEWLKQELYMNIPMKPLCDEDCSGLCQNCGTNKNTNKCNCKTEKIDPRLAVLSELLKK